LSFLSGELCSSILSENLAESLVRESGASVVLVNFEAQDAEGATRDGTRPDSQLNGEFHMPSAFRKTEAGVHSVVLGVGNEPPSPAGITSLIGQLSHHFRYILLAIRWDECSAPWLAECMHRSDLVYLFLRAATEDSTNLENITRQMPVQSDRRMPHTRVIGCVADGEKTEAFDLLQPQAANPVHMFVRGCPILPCAKPASQPTGTFDADLRRLSREISGRLVGLALSSGAAKGYAHIGVIQVLEENGIEVDVVAGSSMGSYIGSLWAYGFSGAQMENLAREMEGRWSLWSLIDPAFPPRQGFLRGFAVKKRLMRTINNARFADLARPLRIVAGNLATLERVVFSGGEVAAAVHASSAVPGICVPVTINSETYIDGAVVDPLPVDVLREMGVARVIAVNVIPTPARIRSGLHAGREPKQHRQGVLRRLFRKLIPGNPQLNYFARKNLFEILLRSIYGAQIRIAEASCLQADLVLRPEISDDRWVDCCNPGKFIALGRQAAEQHLEEIRALVATREETHEKDTAKQKIATMV
jgi:NTE family protein